MDLTNVAPLPLTSGGAPELLLSETAGRDVIAGREAVRALTSVRTIRLTCKAKEREFFTAERVTPGAVVSPGMVLVGKATQRDPHLLSPVEIKLDAIRGVRETTLDTSLRCPRFVRGTAVSVQERRGRVKVTIRAERPLAVGDVLRTAGGAIAVVGAIEDEVPGGGDLAWPGLSGRHEVHKVACAEDRLRARCIGPYGIRRHQPIARRTEGVERVGPGAVQALLSRGARATLHEMLTVKSDDIDGRLATFVSIVDGAPAARPRVPFSTQTLEAGLRALGFVVDLREEEPTIAPATTETVRAFAPDVVTEPEFITQDELSPRKGGLFCQEIFGRLGSRERRLRFGRVDLPEPVLHPWARGVVASLLDVPVAEVQAILDHEAVLPRHAGEDVPPPGAVALREELALLDLPALASAGGARGETARTLLRAGIGPRDLFLEAWPVLPPAYRPSIKISSTTFAVADLNHHYRRLINRATRIRRMKALDAPPVILRDQVQALQEAVNNLVENGLHGTWFEDGDRKLASLVDEVGGPSSPLALALEGKAVDFAGAATVVARADLPPDRAQIPREAALEIYRPWIYAALLAARGGSVKFARRLVDKRDRRALAALRGMPPLVLLHEDGAPRVTSVEMVPWDEPAVGLSPRTIEALGLAPGDAVAFHVPIDPDAVAGARTRPRGLVTAEAPVEDDGWLTRAARAPKADLGEILYAAALHGEKDPAKSTLVRVLLGRRP